MSYQVSPRSDFRVSQPTSRKRPLSALLLATLIVVITTMQGGDAGASDNFPVDSFPLAPKTDSSLRVVPATFLGMTVGKLGVHFNWPGMHTHILRLWDTHTRWMDVEPAKGTWDFSRTDKYVDFAQKNGAEVLITLGQTPKWAATNPTAKCHYDTGCSPPADIDDWRDYVRTLASRYRLRVKYWELWNEPDNPPFWRGSPQQLAVMADIAREEIKRANPAAKLIGPGLGARGFAFLGNFLAAGGGDSLDAISFHAKPNETVAEVSATITGVRQVTKANGLQDKPLWNSEFGITCLRFSRTCGKGAEETNAAIQRVLASLFIMAAENIESADFYFYERGAPSSPFSLVYAPSFEALTPAGQAYETAASLLDGATVTDSYKVDDVLVVTFSNKGANHVALWNAGETRFMQTPRSWKFAYSDLLTKTQITNTRGLGLELPASTLVIGSIFDN